MAKRILELSKELFTRNGFKQINFEIKNIHIREDKIVVDTEQCNVIEIPIDEEIQSFIIKIEDMVKNSLEIPDVVSIPPIETPKDNPPIEVPETPKKIIKI